MQREGGFTLIELIIVIVILGVLSAFAIPKFADISDEAKVSVHVAVADAFNAGIRIARTAYIVETGSSAGAAEDIKIYSTSGRYGTVDFNSNGWPSQSYDGSLESNPTTGNSGDCRSIWTAIMQENTVKVGSNFSSDYRGRHLGSGVCEYINSETQTLSFEYDSNTGVVTIDDVI